MFFLGVAVARWPDHRFASTMHLALAAKSVFVMPMYYELELEVSMVSGDKPVNVWLIGRLTFTHQKRTDV